MQTRTPTSSNARIRLTTPNSAPKSQPAVCARQNERAHPPERCPTCRIFASSGSARSSDPRCGLHSARDEDRARNDNHRSCNSLIAVIPGAGLVSSPSRSTGSSNRACPCAEGASLILIKSRIFSASHTRTLNMAVQGLPPCLALRRHFSGDTSDEARHQKQESPAEIFARSIPARPSGPSVRAEHVAFFDRAGRGPRRGGPGRRGVCGL